MKFTDHDKDTRKIIAIGLASEGLRGLGKLAQMRTKVNENLDARTDNAADYAEDMAVATATVAIALLQAAACNGPSVTTFSFVEAALQDLTTLKGLMEIDLKDTLALRDVVTLAVQELGWDPKLVTFTEYPDEVVVRIAPSIMLRVTKQKGEYRVSHCTEREGLSPTWNIQVEESLLGYGNQRIIDNAMMRLRTVLDEKGKSQP